MARRTAEENRAAITAAARELFAAQGYAATTIRAIGDRSGVDPAMVMRYFGSKEQLFTQSVDLDLGLGRTGELPAIDRAGEFIARQVLRVWEDHEVPLVVLRTAMDHEPARERLRAVAVEQVAPLLRALGVPEAESGLRAALVGSQAIGLALVRLVGKIEPVASASDDEIVRWYGPTFQRYVTGAL